MSAVFIEVRMYEEVPYGQAGHERYAAEKIQVAADIEAEHLRGEISAMTHRVVAAFRTPAPAAR